jgi:hypothetical protein
MLLKHSQQSDFSWKGFWSFVLHEYSDNEQKKRGGNRSKRREEEGKIEIGK